MAQEVGVQEDVGDLSAAVTVPLALSLTILFAAVAFLFGVLGLRADFRVAFGWITSVAVALFLLLGLGPRSAGGRFVGPPAIGLATLLAWPAAAAWLHHLGLASSAAAWTAVAAGTAVVSFGFAVHIGSRWLSAQAGFIVAVFGLGRAIGSGLGQALVSFAETNFPEHQLLDWLARSGLYVVSAGIAFGLAWAVGLVSIALARSLHFRLHARSAGPPPPVGDQPGEAPPA